MFHGFIPHIMGTRFDLLLIHPDPQLSNKLWGILSSELERLEKTLNRFDPESKVTQLNEQLSQQPAPVSEELWDILQLCRYYYEKTLGLFDITLKDFSQINFHNDRHISSGWSGLSFDFGGFAKGYALKKLQELILAENIEHAFVDFGNSSMMGIGHHPYGDCWKVGFLNPYNKSLLNEFELRNSTLSTSGNTQQYTHHIINPLTGIYDTQRKATTIVSNDPLDAEILSTAWMIADERQKQQMTANFKNIQGAIYTL